MEVQCDIAYKTRAGDKVFLSILNESNLADSKDFVFEGSNGFSYNRQGKIYSGKIISKHDIVDYFYKEDRGSKAFAHSLNEGIGMKVHLGRSYITRGGDIARIVDTADENTPYDFIADNGDTYFNNGCYLPGGPGHEKDLIGLYSINPEYDGISLQQSKEKTEMVEDTTAQTKEVLNAIELSAKEQLLSENQKFSDSFFIIKRVKNGYILTPTDTIQGNGLYKEVEEYVFSSSAELGEFIERRL